MRRVDAGGAVEARFHALAVVRMTLFRSPESQRQGLFETRAPVTNVAIPLVRRPAKDLHSLEPGLWPR